MKALSVYGENIVSDRMYEHPWERQLIIQLIMTDSDDVITLICAHFFSHK